MNTPSSPQGIERIKEVISHWRQPAELADFAEKRHGYGDTNGGFGVTYPEDLDEYARQVERAHIPVGQVEIYGYWGVNQGYELLVPEKLYLTVLAEHLQKVGLQMKLAVFLP